ncbi:MAG: helix-turn-helix domain-containing protein [Blastocatellia bacterium]
MCTFRDLREIGARPYAIFRAMIKLNVREVAEAKGFANASALASATGVHRTSMYRIWDGAATRLDLETLDRLCEVLKVPAGMLLTHIPKRELRAEPTSSRPRSVSRSRGED